MNEFQTLIIGIAVVVMSIFGWCSHNDYRKYQLLKQGVDPSHIRCALGTSNASCKEK